MSAAIYHRLRGILFALDAERAHRAAVRAAHVAGALLAHLPPLSVPGTRGPRLGQNILGLDFPNPIGLAAGFDKDGIAPHLWPALGFGFAEIGTVTGRPQPGNPRPRLFRLVEDRGLINRLGFNGQGSAVVAARLRRTLVRRPPAPIGLNVGCSKAAIGDPLAELEDYRISVRELAPLADYVAVNVSSPNTPGLRDLQTPEKLARLVRALVEEIGRRTDRRPPLLVKLAPDLPREAIAEVCGAALAAGAVGFIAGNTTLSREGLRSVHSREAGGLSGAPLRARATELVARVRESVGGGIPVIGVGGVSDLGDVLEKFAAGADLVGLYSALVYEGPWLAARLARDLDRHLADRGIASVAEVTGGRSPA